MGREVGTQTTPSFLSLIWLTNKLDIIHYHHKLVRHGHSLLSLISDLCDVTCVWYGWVWYVSVCVYICVHVYTICLSSTSPARPAWHRHSQWPCPGPGQARPHINPSIRWTLASDIPLYNKTGNYAFIISMSDCNGSYHNNGLYYTFTLLICLYFCQSIPIFFTLQFLFLDASASLGLGMSTIRHVEKYC